MKKRLDLLLVELGYFDSREKARTAIMSNKVKLAGKLMNKAGHSIKAEEAKKLEIVDNVCPYVSRGGYKLEAAIKNFTLDLKDAVAFDLGASTGGFTDCALQHGVKHVISCDVGRGQLDYKLR
ncbi:MAG: TlyA family rRNA (cytidine-2'-O)-methyltransferase, partial [Phototrophicales bacterium]